MMSIRMTMTVTSPYRCISYRRTCHYYSISARAACLRNSSPHIDGAADYHEKLCRNLRKIAPGWADCLDCLSESDEFTGVVVVQV